MASGGAGEECRQDQPGGEGRTGGRCGICHRAGRGNQEKLDTTCLPCCDQTRPYLARSSCIKDCMGRGFLVFLLIFQTVLFAAHFVVLATWLTFWGAPAAGWPLRVAQLGAFLLAASFLSASLLSFRFWNAFTRTFYRAAAAWLGVVNFLFFASFGVWLTATIKTVGGFHWANQAIVGSWFAVALLAALWGMINASWTRVSRISVRLPNLPD